MERETKTCPHCGAALPRDASFCPHCAQAVNRRRQMNPPRLLPLRPVVLALAAALLLLAAGTYLRTRPRVYDNGGAEVLYDLDGRTCQVCIAYPEVPTWPVIDRPGIMPVAFDARYPALLYANDTATGAPDADAFLPYVDHIDAEILQEDGSDRELRASCTPPERMQDYYPEAAACTFLDVYLRKAGEYQVQLVFTVHMKNGDTLRLWQNQLLTSVVTYTYTPEDAPMSTVAELQALLDEIGRTVEEDAEVNIHLPPVTYDGELAVDRREVYLYGSVDEAGHRTTFTAPVRVDYPGGGLSYFENVDFTGPGSGTGVTSGSRLTLTGCRFSGWETAVYSGGTAWIDADECVFSDNTVGLHFNNAEGDVTDDMYVDDLFQDNGTAVLLERTGTNALLEFPGTRFTGNGTDIDNRCGQEVDLTEAVLE